MRRTFTRQRVGRGSIRAWATRYAYCSAMCLLSELTRAQLNIAWKLALVYKGLASPELLATYEIERLPVIAHMLAATSGLYIHITNTQPDDGPAGAGKESTGFLKWRDNALRQLDINYR